MLQILQYPQENTCWSLFLLNLQACNFLKKRIQRGCSSVSIEKFLRTPILKNIWEWLLFCLTGIFGLYKKTAGSIAKVLWLQISTIFLRSKKIDRISQLQKVESFSVFGLTPLSHCFCLLEIQIPGKNRQVCTYPRWNSYVTLMTPVYSGIKVYSIQLILSWRVTSFPCFPTMNYSLF